MLWCYLCTENAGVSEKCKEKKKKKKLILFCFLHGCAMMTFTTLHGTEPSLHLHLSRT